MTAVTVGSGRKNSLAVGALLRYAVAAAAAACCVSGCGPADDGAQCTALGQLFHATGGPQWQRNAGWLKPRVSYCSWAGVTCDLKNFEQKRAILKSVTCSSLPRVPRRVSRASAGSICALREQRARGARLLYNGVPCVFAGYNVVALNLSKNSLNGTLGPFIAAFPSLTELNLWSNELGGSLPDSLRNLRQLRDLNVYDNLLSGTVSGLLRLWVIVSFRTINITAW